MPVSFSLLSAGSHMGLCEGAEAAFSRELVCGGGGGGDSNSRGLRGRPGVVLPILEQGCHTLLGIRGDSGQAGSFSKY